MGILEISVSLSATLTSARDADYSRMRYLPLTTLCIDDDEGVIRQ